MTTIEVAAMLASSILVKGSVVAAGLMIAGRFLATSASRATLILGLGPGTLALVLLLGPFFPQFNPGFVAIGHGAVQPVSIGPFAPSPAMVAVLVWAIGAVVMLGRFVRDLIAALTLENRATRHTGKRAAELLQRAARAVGLTRVPELRETSELTTAALIGFRRPVLLVPRQAREWSDEELFGVLCHELEHVRRNDWLMLMIERIVTAIFWINPLVHMLGRFASGARERAADDAAMLAGAGASAYASRLISVARDLKRAPRLAVSVAFADGGRVDQRVRALFEPRDRRGTAPMAMLRAALVALPFIVTLAAVEPWSCLPSTAPTSEGCP
jgi:beta-lactamase regulating signal transducer with metallopeptidase domain